MKKKFIELQNIPFDFPNKEHENREKQSHSKTSQIPAKKKSKNKESEWQIEYRLIYNSYKTEI